MPIIFRTLSKDFSLTAAQAKQCNIVKTLLEDCEGDINTIVVDLSYISAPFGCDDPNDPRNLHYKLDANGKLVIPAATKKLLNEKKPVYVAQQILDAIKEGAEFLSKEDAAALEKCPPVFVDPIVAPKYAAVESVEQAVKFLIHEAVAETNDKAEHEKWNRVFMRSQSNDMLDDLIILANFLDCASLAHWATKRMAAMIKGKTFEEIAVLLSLDVSRFSEIAKHDMLMNNEWRDDTEEWYPTIANVDEIAAANSK